MGTLSFHKYQGTGNDFIMVDDREEQFDLSAHQLIARLCHRRFGIGADGLILLRSHHEADFEMIYYNADGFLTSLCGNGSRCAVKFAHQLGIISSSCSFVTVEGILDAKISGDLVHIKMPDVSAIETHDDHYYLHTGSPHHVCYVNDIKNYDVFHYGKEIREGAPYFKEGTNVNFVEPLQNGALFVRTYERGVENETLSCGTGVTAAALVSGLEGAVSPVAVLTLGGELQISFEKTASGQFKNIYLIGPAEQIFAGKIGI